MAAKMFLVDGSNHAFRVHFALPPMHAADGHPTRALYGFTTMFAKMLRVHKPDYVVVSFDTGKTFRHDMYTEYKGNRPPMPDDLAAQWPQLPALVEGFGYRCVAVDGYEADDVLATLALRFAGPDLDVFVVTGDKDFGQIVGDHIRILDLMKERELGPEEVEGKLGVPPGQVVDALALAGDSSDNIPGVPGIGMKTAAGYLKKYPDLESILEAASRGEIKGKRGQSLVDHADNARLSYRLATIATDVPIPLELADLESRGLQEESLRQLFDRYDFGKVARNLLPRRKVVDPKTFRAVTDRAGLDEVVGAIRDAGTFAYGFELDSPDPGRAEVVGVRLAWEVDGSAYVPIRQQLPAEAPPAPAQGSLFGDEDQPEPSATWSEGIAAEELWRVIGPLLADPELPKIGHRVKHDYAVLERLGLPLRGVTGDTMLLDYCLFAHEKTHGLQAMAQRFLGHISRPYADIVDGRRMGMADLAPKKAARYACEDVVLCLMMYRRLEPRLSDGQRHVYNHIELPLIPVLAEMERVGIRLDLQRLEAQSAEVGARADAAEARCHELAGRPFNVNSRHELREILFEELGLPPSKKVKDGWSTDQSVLEKLMDQHELPGALLEHRSLKKLKSTYLDKLGSFVASDGRIHTSFNQAVAATGRLSSADPNLQNIPVRTEGGRRVRDCFVPEPGYRFLSCDYSQIELRVLAHYCGEPALIEAFTKGIDIHRRTASEVFGVPFDEVTGDQRTAAKAINFGLVYGMSAFRLAGDLAISREEATRYMEEYFGRLPLVQQWIEDRKVHARREGYVETLFGRRRVITGIHAQRFAERMAAEREAVNTFVQGTAADLVKMAMVRVVEALRESGSGARLLLQVHDELLLEVPEPELDTVSALVVERMEGVASLVVPLRVNSAIGDTWNEAHG